MAATHIKYLRQTVDSRFTTTNTTITFAQYDSTLQGLKDDIDSVVLAVSAITTHTQETDRYLKRGSAQEYDSYYNFRGSFDGTFGNDAVNTVKFLTSDANLFASVADYEIQIYGLKEDGDGITQRVEVGYKDKGLNGFIAMPTEDCRIVWQVLSNLRAKTGI